MHARYIVHVLVPIATHGIYLIHCCLYHSYRGRGRLLSFSKCWCPTYCTNSIFSHVYRTRANFAHATM